MDAPLIWSIAGVVVAIATALLGFIFGYAQHRRSQRTTINVAQSQDRNRGFDNLIAAVDGIQHYLCRQNAGDTKLSGDEIHDLRMLNVRRLTNGVELLTKYVQNYEMVNPVLGYIEELYLQNDMIMMADILSLEQYENCRDMLVECMRACNELDDQGDARKVADAIEKQRARVQAEIDRGIHQKAKAADGSVFMAGDGDAILSILDRDAAAISALEKLTRVCEARVAEWKARGL